MKLSPLTEASKPDELIETIHGEIEYQRWCHNMVVEIKRDPARQAEVRYDDKGRCNVWADDIGKHDLHGRDDCKAVYPRQYTVTNKRLGVRRGKYAKS